jgi:hypothetical protein
MDSTDVEPQAVDFLMALLRQLVSWLLYCLVLSIATASAIDLNRGVPAGELVLHFSLARCFALIPASLFVHNFFVRPLRWAVGSRARMLCTLAACVGGVPMVLAWIVKLTYHAAQWAVRGDANWAHTFRETASDAMVRVAFRLGVDEYIAGTTPYESMGLAPSMAHWRMGAFLTVRLAVLVLPGYVAWRLLRSFWASVRTEAAVRRRKFTAARPASR